ncbi:hypothetical protein MKJ01_02670 [Chryseobacterium sp. SSA4.19]|uniref:hypothetical protein n=1 Tax=Chryseobacterium sp. SSA4.19 TaxID=2919915 RepID=UPI001F4EB44C|nr:hypothetical protein [Chryseobacterium sp. SSA4.19]MCJ8152665.1 hypothetical protein [Chryseobacterium sp. SSA4.19]
MHYDLLRKITLVFLIPFAFIIAHAQQIPDVSMEIRSESGTSENNIIDLTVILKNNSKIPFKGKINVNTPQGFKAVSFSGINVDLDAGEGVFLPVKILVNNNAVSGEKKIDFNLIDQQEHAVSEKFITYHVAEKNTLRITAENPVIYMNNTRDSVEVRARVSNLGNIRQNVTVVFKIPEISQGTIFIEKKASIEIGKDSVFTFRFMPSSLLVRTSQFSVSIAGFRDPEKEIFGNASVSVQNVVSTQHYQDLQDNSFSNDRKNSITAGYRRVGQELNMYQLIGSGGFNLPSGYVTVRGNIYTVNNQNELVANNTFITYHRRNSEYTLGNISKIMEMSLFGRGTEIALTSSDKDKRVEVGFVDQTFSLVEKSPFLKYGYGFFTRGTLGAQNGTRNISATYVFRNDPYENSRHNLLGTDMQYAFNKDWNMNVKVYSGLSLYDRINVTKPSLALESKYSGVVNKLNLNGNYFYSTDYYPGNRRGMLQIQQNISAAVFKDYNVYANISVSNFSPKFYFYNDQLISNTTRLDTGINFPKKGNLGLTMGLQYQDEKSNTYNNFFDTAINKDFKQLKAQRITDYMTWSSPDRKHSSVVGIEAGMALYPDTDHAEYQMKAIGNYSYKWLNVNFIYQQGSYFLSEYAFSRIFNESSAYKKFSFSAFMNENFFDQKLTVTSGINYTDDMLYGKSPSGFVNLKYSGVLYGLHLNTSWFHYSSRGSSNNVLSIEAGVTLNLKSSTLNPGKKGNVTAFVYYDNNNNGVYDDGDQAAPGYLVMLNAISFRTDSNGNLNYKGLPFGKYALKQIIQKGWYYDEAEIEVNRFNHALEIPLHQNGTLQGKIDYEFNSKTALEFEPKSGGIIFNIYKKDQLLQRVVTDDNGEFISFLESGDYKVEINENSLPPNTYVERSSAEIKVEAGKIVTIDAFIIKVKEKKIRVKKFGSE